jgi:hypothetical protein
MGHAQIRGATCAAPKIVLGTLALGSPCGQNVGGSYLGTKKSPGV